MRVKITRNLEYKEISTTGDGENECQISQNDILHMRFYNFTCVFTILVKFDIQFLRLPCEIFFVVITDD